MRRGYDRVEGSIGRSYDEIKDVTMSVSRNFHMLSEITTGKKVEKLDSSVVTRWTVERLYVQMPPTTEIKFLSCARSPGLLSQFGKMSTDFRWPGSPT